MIKKKIVFLNVIIGVLLALFFISCPNTITGDIPEDAPVTPTTYSLTTNSENGSISRTPDAENYNTNTTVSLEATANTDYEFLHWEGDFNESSANENPVSVTMSADKTVTAVFVPVGTTVHTVSSTISPVGSGTVSPNPVNVADGSDTTLTAAPAEGYKFSEWLDGATQLGTDSSLTLTNITADRNITAEFVPEGWTILVHFAVDNNIDYDFESSNGIVSNYLATLESIEAGDTYNNIDIIVLMDGYNEDTQGNGYATIFQDGYYHLTGGNFSDDLDVTIAEVNSGSTDDTEAYMDWAVTNYPADHYIYSVFNHGGGFDDTNIAGTYGIAFDDSDDDALSHNELSQVTSYLKGLIGKNIDLFYPYACLMGGVELAYEIRNNADYLLFSEELFPAELWSYEALSSISLNQVITGEEIGTAFCDSAYTYFTTVSSRDFTLSLIDLSNIDSLYSSINTYAQTAAFNISNNSTTASYYNTAAEDTFSMYSAYGVEWYYMDLGDYLSNINDNSNINSTVKNAANNTNSALNNAVVYKKQNGYPDSTGITIFHNIWNSPYQYSVSTYEEILSFGTNNWVNYLTAMEDLTVTPPGDEYEPDDSFAEATSISIDGTAQNHTIHIAGQYGDYDFIQFNLTADQWYKVETYDNGGSSMDTILWIYNTAQTAIASNDDSNGAYSAITFQCSSSGTYYAAVAGYDTGDYAIDIETTTAPAGDAYEPDNSFAEATSTSVNGVAQNHTIHISGDQDYVKFELTAGTSYKVETYDNGGSSMDTELYLYNSTYSQIGYDDDSNGVYSAITYSCTSSGTYYAMVRGYADSSTGDYAIDIESGSFSIQSDLKKNIFKK